MIKFFFCLALLFYGSASGQSVLDLVSGGPSHIDVLGAGGFVEFSVYRVKKPELLYLNTSLLAHMGVDVGGFTPSQLRAQALEAFAWFSQINEHTDPKQTRTAFTDFYGGEGLGSYRGSARAGILGQVQIKGIGLTPLGFESTVRDGTVGLHEGIKEIVWGEFLHRLLPYGANRVVALIATGVVNSDGEPKVIIVRQDPLRAGHFITNVSDQVARLVEVRKNLPLVLQHHNPGEARLLAEVSGVGESARQMLLVADEWMYRITRQMARAHLQRVYHGAPSQSNININGQYIDYGTSSTNSGFGPIQFLSHVEAFGLYSELSRAWGDSWAQFMLGDLKAELPANVSETVTKVYQEYLKTALETETLRNFGLPEDKILAAYGDVEVKKLSELLFKLVEYRKVARIDIQSNPMPESTSDIRFRDVLLALAESIDNPRALETSGVDFKVEAAEWTALREQWILAADRLRLVIGPVRNLKNYLKFSIQWRNRDRAALYRDRLRATTRALENGVRARNVGVLSGLSGRINDIIEDVEPRWRGFDDTRFIPIRVLRVYRGVRSVEAYDVSNDTVVRLREGSKGLVEVISRSRDVRPPRPVRGGFCVELFAI